jgi:hypothetical protein
MVGADSFMFKVCRLRVRALEVFDLGTAINNLSINISSKYNQKRFFCQVGNDKK